MAAPGRRKTQKKTLQWLYTGLNDAAPVEAQSRKDLKEGIGHPGLSQSEARKLRKEGERQKKWGGWDLRKEQLKLRPLQPATLDMLPPPFRMSVPQLGRAACIAAREEEGGSTKFWEQVSDRARDLMPQLAPQDLAMIISGMSRSGHKDDELANEFLDVILDQISFFNAKYFLMVLDAYSRFNLCEQRVEPLFAELKNRVHEFQQSQHVVNALVALGNFKLCDLELVLPLSERLSGQDVLHAREWARVAKAYSELNCLDQVDMVLVARGASQTLHEATPQELCSLLSAVVQGRIGQIADFVSFGARLVREKIPFMIADELAEAKLTFELVLRLDHSCASTAEGVLAALAESAPVRVLSANPEAKQLPPRTV